MTRNSIWKRIFSNHTARFGVILVLSVVFLGLFAPWIAIHDPYEVNPLKSLQGPSKDFPFGTDLIGRCIYSRTVYGTRLTLMIGLVALGIALFSGVIIGLISGYYKRIDNIIMRIIDVVMAFPSFLIAVVIVAILGPGLWNVVWAVGIGNIPPFARVIRSLVLSIREAEYVKAAIVMGNTDFRIIYIHITRNVISPIIVYSTIQMGWALLAISSLGFVGLGAKPPAAEWGALASEGRNYLRVAPLMAIMPSLFVFITVLGFNLLGDSLRDALDPTL